MLNRGGPIPPHNHPKENMAETTGMSDEELVQKFDPIPLDEAEKILSEKGPEELGRRVVARAWLIKQRMTEKSGAS